MIASLAEQVPPLVVADRLDPHPRPARELTDGHGRLGGCWSEHVISHVVRSTSGGPSEVWSSREAG